MPYSGQMIDSHLVTSLHDKKSRRGKRRHQSIQPLRCGAQRRGDALPNSKQQGPRSDTWVRLSPFKPATLDFCLGELFCFEDVQSRCFILRSVLPTRARFLIDIFFSFFRADQDLTRIAAGENMCERRSAKGMGCLWSPKEKQRGLNTN